MHALVMNSFCRMIDDCNTLMQTPQPELLFAVQVQCHEMHGFEDEVQALVTASDGASWLPQNP